MAIPRSLKPIPKEKALKLIDKHLQANTGGYEYDNNLGDFIFPYRGHWYLIRNVYKDNYEIGRVSL